MTILATCVRNEGPYLLEWIAYNKLIGFQKIVVYSNNNQDGSDRLLALLHDGGHITWRPRVLPAHISPQASAFEALSQELLHDQDPNLLRDIAPEYRYLAWLDCDEYLYLRQPGIDSIQNLLAAYSFPAGISLNWKHFGSSGHEYYEPGLTIDRFQRCAPTSFPLNKMLKTICKLDRNLFPGVITQHRPCNRNPSARIIYPGPNQMSLEVPSAFLDQGIFASDIVDALIVHDVCHLNHYAVRSFQEYQLKQSRGNGWDIVSANKPAYPDDYFISRDRNEEKDSAISDKYSSKLQGAIQSYDSKIVELSEFIQSRAIKRRAAQTN